MNIPIQASDKCDIPMSFGAVSVSFECTQLTNTVNFNPDEYVNLLSANREIAGNNPWTLLWRITDYDVDAAYQDMIDRMPVTKFSSEKHAKTQLMYNIFYKLFGEILAHTTLVESQLIPRLKEIMKQYGLTGLLNLNAMNHYLIK